MKSKLRNSCIMMALCLLSCAEGLAANQEIRIADAVISRGDGLTLISTTVLHFESFQQEAA